MTWSDEHGGITNYRVDRMADVRIEKEPVNESAIIRTTEVADYTEQAFKMYTGTECAATLQFENSLIGVVYDKFGEDTTKLLKYPEKSPRRKDYCLVSSNSPESRNKIQL